MRFYADIQRVDEEQRMVWGYASTEQRASDGMVITRDAMSGALDDYMRFANIREMHRNSAVGTTEEANVDETGLYIGAHVVDDAAWQKVLKRVYKGFSIGAKITERDPDDKSLVRGLAIREISLVDRPADPGAVFDCYRADGMSDEDELDLDDGYVVVINRTEPGGEAEVLDVRRRDFTEKQRKDMAAKGEAMPDGSFPIANRQDLENAIRAVGRAKDKRAAKRHIMKRARALGATDLIPDDWKNGAERADGAADDAEETVARTDEAENPPAEAAEAAERADAAAEVDNAVQTAGDGQDEAERADGEGETAAEAAEPPQTDVERAIADAQAASAELKAAIEAAQPAAEAEETVARVLPGGELRRGMYDVGQLGRMLSELAYMAVNAEYEAMIEADNSPVPGKLRQNLIDLGKTFRAMADEELAELISSVGIDMSLEGGVLNLCAAAGDLQRSEATISDDQAARIQAAFDALVERGWTPKAPEPSGEPPAEVADLQRQVGALTEDKDVLNRALGDMATEMRAQASQLKELLERTAPAKTAGLVTRVVSKGEDAVGPGDHSAPAGAQLTNEDIQRHLDSLPALERAELLVRASLSRPLPLAAVRSPGPITD